MRKGRSINQNRLVTLLFRLTSSLKIYALFIYSRMKTELDKTVSSYRTKLLHSISKGANTKEASGTVPLLLLTTVTEKKPMLQYLISSISSELLSIYSRGTIVGRKRPRFTCYTIETFARKEKKKRKEKVRMFYKS